MSSEALRVARDLARAVSPQVAAAAVGAVFEGSADKGVFTLSFLGAPVSIRWPELELVDASRTPPHIEALLFYHIARSDGSTPSGRWISFAELPDGGYYVAAFRGYTAAAIVRRFAGAPDTLEAAMARVSAVPLAGHADRAWLVEALPRVPVAVLWWDADDEFEARAELLFDATASRHLTTDGCAVLGSWLTAMIVRG